MHASLPNLRSLAAAALLVLCAQSAFAAAPAGKWTAEVQSTTRFLSYTATVPLLGKPTKITLAFSSDPTHTKDVNGTIGFDLYIDKIAALAPFAFDDFDGPDAITADRTLMVVTIARKGKPALTFKLSPNGFHPHETNFAFGVAEMSHVPVSEPKTIVRALAAGAESLRITITDPRNAQRKLDVTVPVAGKEAEFKALLAGLK